MLYYKVGKNTYYTKRYSFVNGKQTFFVFMPQAPEDALVMIYNSENGLMHNDKSFNVSYKLFNTEFIPGI